MWWADLLWGFWNGLTAWIVFVVHVFGGWEQFPFYSAARSGSWYDFGFLLGAGSPILSAARGRNAEESQAAQSRRADFSSKLSIACKEAREMHYGLRLLAASDIVGEPRLAELLDEADQLIASSSQSPRK